jgi:hypothetical protein
VIGKRASKLIRRFGSTRGVDGAAIAAVARSETQTFAIDGRADRANRFARRKRWPRASRARKVAAISSASTSLDDELRRGARASSCAPQTRKQAGSRSLDRIEPSSKATSASARRRRTS